MKLSILAFLLFLSTMNFAQSEVNIYTERKGSQVIIYVDNPAIIPMTVDLKLDLTNMKTDFGDNKGIFVVPQRSKKYKIVTADAIKRNGRTGLGLESYIYIGDISKDHDDSYVYDLPFSEKASYVLTQGYNGRFSHQGENALDFGLEVGEKVFAARGGIVYNVIEKNTKSCKRSSCQEFNNYVTVYHSDGTFSEYSHLKYNGAAVNVGQQIDAGDFIGNSGNTGWSSGPHLHFVVYKYNKTGQRETIKTKFKTSTSKSTYLKENKTYTK